VWNRIIAIDLASRERRQIFQAPTTFGIPLFFRLSPDGRVLAIRRRDPSDKKAHYGVVSVDGSGYREIHTAAGDGAFDVLCWLPDGQSLLVEEQDVSKWRIVRVPLTGGPPVPTNFQGTGRLDR
jgi:hypothetical protein